MKIIQNNKEYGYQQPIINNIDVLLDVSNNSGLTSGTYNLSSSIDSYERLICTVWPQNTAATASMSRYAMSCDVSVSDFTTDHGCIVTVWSSTNNNYVYVAKKTSTSVSLLIGSGALCGRIKVEGVKRTAQVSNLGVWEDITSRCTFHNSDITASNTKVYANPLFIYIGHYGRNGSADSSLIITLPVGYEAFGGISGSQYRQQWSGGSAITSTSSTSMSFGKGRYIWVCIPNGGGQSGSLNGILLRTV